MKYYVNAAATSVGDGSKAKPFKKIQSAAKIAMPGDEVIVAPGIYREWVNPVNGGTDKKRITYRSETPFGAHITEFQIPLCRQNRLLWKRLYKILNGGLKRQKRFRSAA